jgi:hypothetical protein
VRRAHLRYRIIFLNASLVELLGKQTGTPLEGHNCYVSSKHPARTVCTHSYRQLVERIRVPITTETETGSGKLEFIQDLCTLMKDIVGQTSDRIGASNGLGASICTTEFYKCWVPSCLFLQNDAVIFSSIGLIRDNTG